MTLDQLNALKRKYSGPDAAGELASYARAMRARAQERAATASAATEAKHKDRAEREQADKRRKATIAALRRETSSERAEKGERTLQHGEKGGTFYVNEQGEKVYVRE